MIEAVGALRDAGVDVRLVLVGDGPQRERLERLVDASGLRDRVEFRGAVAHTEVERILHGADIFCLPSFAEGVPIVLMEAMAMELPVVACRVMGIPELIEDDVTGRLVRPGSRDALVDALSVLAADSDRRASLGRAARERVAAEFELRSNVGPTAGRLLRVPGPLMRPGRRGDPRDAGLRRCRRMRRRGNGRGVPGAAADRDDPRP